MGFISRFREETTPPSKVYVHTAGEPLFERTCQGEYFRTVVEYEEKRFRDYSFLIGIVWGDEKTSEKVADIFGFSTDGKWESNPGVDNWVFRDGIYCPNDEITCGEGLMVLGEEMRLRQNSPSLAHYLDYGPNLDHLSFELEEDALRRE